jgi:hypothetical protein
MTAQGSGMGNAQIVPGSGSPQVSDQIRRAQRLAVCKILGD